MFRKTALIACTDLAGYCYGEQHPFKVQRYRLAHDLMEAYGLLDPAETELVRPRPVTETELLTAHCRDYLDRLRSALPASRGRISATAWATWRTRSFPASTNGPAWGFPGPWRRRGWSRKKVLMPPSTRLAGTTTPREAAPPASPT